MPQRTSFWDRMPPRFGGGAIVPDLHAVPGTREGLFKMDNHSGMR